MLWPPQRPGSKPLWCEADKPDKPDKADKAAKANKAEMAASKSTGLAFEVFLRRKKTGPEPGFLMGRAR